MRRLQEALTWVFDNVPAPAALIGAGVGAVLTAAGVADVSVGTTIILSLLAVLAMGLIVERVRYLRPLRVELGGIARPGASAFLKDRNDPEFRFDRFVSGAADVLVIGPSLLNSIVTQGAVWRDLLQKNCSLRFVVIDPKSSAVREVSRTIDPTVGPGDSELLPAAIPLSLTALKDLRTAAAKLEPPARVDVRVFDGILTHSVLAVDRGGGDEEIVIELHPYRIMTTQRPHFIVSSGGKDEPWCRLFRGQAEAIWSMSRTVDD